MEINHKFFNYIKPYLIKLQEKIGNDFVVFGSAPLYLLGVVEFGTKINDLDISLRREEEVPKNATVVLFHGDKERKFYKITIDNLVIDMSSLWPGCEYYFDKIHENPIIIEGFKFANLDIVEEWKREMVKRYDREKDKDYLKRINIFKEGNKN